jgi:hypothetical protein
LARLSFTIQLRGGWAHPHCQQLAIIETETSLVTRAPRLFIAADLAFGLHCAGTDLRRSYGLGRHRPDRYADRHTRGGLQRCFSVTAILEIVRNDIPFLGF